MRPSAKVISEGSAPCSGDCASATAAVASAPRRFSHARNTADPEVSAPNEPPDPAVGGKLVSPISTRTWLIGRPVLSAAIWVSTV